MPTGAGQGYPRRHAANPSGILKPMGSALEALAPLLAAFPTAEAPLTPDDLPAIARLTSAVERVAAPDLEGAMIGPDPSFRVEFHGADGLVERWSDWLSPYESF